MDSSRKADLEFLDQASKGASSSELAEIGDTRRKIIAQSKDKKLVEMRRQLVNATRQGRGSDARIINERIRDHERGTRY